MTPGQFILLASILLLILAFVGLPWISMRRRRPDAWNPSASYLEAIDALIRGRRGRAMEAIRRIARQETDNWLAYLRLGDLVRVMGYPDRAQRIHAGLLARPTDDPIAATRIRESLLEDHLAQGNWDEAIRGGEALKELDRKNPVALRALTLAYEAKGDWDRAFVHVDEWHRLYPGRALPRPAQVRIQAARTEIQHDRMREARRLLEEAIKLDGGEERGRVLLGEVLARDGEHERAVEHWLACAERNPEQARTVFDRIERSYFELGRFGDLLQVYERLIQQNPGSAPATVALAEMHRRRGRTDEAIALLESVLTAEPKNRPARRLLVSCLLQTRRVDSALREIDVLLQDLPAGEDGAACPRCSYRGDDLEPKCPRCGVWQPSVPSPAPSRGSQI